jgi:hypothetical protein
VILNHAFVMLTELWVQLTWRNNPHQLFLQHVHEG